MNPNVPSSIRALRRTGLAACLAASFATSGPAPAREEPASIPAASLRGVTARTPTGALLVQNCDDSGPGSLRDVLAQAVDGSSIDLTQLACSTITLTSGALLVPPEIGTLHLLADESLPTRPARPSSTAGLPLPRVTISGGDDRVIEHQGSGLLYLLSIAVDGGDSAQAKGGCIYSSGTVYLADSKVSGCRARATASEAALGGGIYARAGVSLSRSAISGNRAESESGYSYGGGIFVRGGSGVSLSNGWIADNQAVGEFSYGGGVAANGPVNLLRMAVTGNRAEFQAGLALFGGPGANSAEIANSTISGNVAGTAVGGVGTTVALSVANSTIAANHSSAESASAGLFLDNVDVALNSTIIADNQAGGVPHDIEGSGAIEGADNLIVATDLGVPPGTLRDDPRLAPLADNGGLTPTHALLPDSPAIDRGSNLAEFNFDQRYRDAPYDTTGIGYERVVGPRADIGAFEFGAPDRIFTNGFDPPI